MGYMSRQSLASRFLCRPERVATLLVQAQLTDHAAAPPNLIARLRGMERTVREMHDGPQSLKVIASGSRLLGDTEEIAPPAPAVGSGHAASPREAG